MAISPSKSIILSLLAAALCSCSNDAKKVTAPVEIYTGIAAGLPTGSATISARGLIAAYDMETRTDDNRLRDFSPSGNHGAISGTASTAGLFGAAMSFSTVADRIDLPETASFNVDGPVSVAVWVRLKTLGLHQHILACDDKFALWITTRDHWRFVDTRGNGYETADGQIETDRWYSVVGVFQGVKGDTLTADNIMIYIDGEPAPGSARTVWNPGILYDSDACYLGFESHQGERNHQTYQFEGLVDECLIFNRDLTPDEIRIHATR
ncbi:MAG: hypothetical protein GKR89_19640 [Candidatus Latescibacteria bacterium]|nr:hypothetical protein [Candidatus Latescibacterota bacterium]